MAQQDVQNGADKAAVAVTFTAVKPQLMVEAPKASDAIQFYKAAFGAEEGAKTLNSKRKAEQETPLILSAELKLAGSTFLVSDNADESKSVGSGAVMCLETDDIEGAISKAVAAGAVAEGEIVEGEGACCGGRVGKVKDPYGYVWLICSASASPAPANDVAA